MKKSFLFLLILVGMFGCSDKHSSSGVAVPTPEPIEGPAPQITKEDCLKEDSKVWIDEKCDLLSSYTVPEIDSSNDLKVVDMQRTYVLSTHYLAKSFEVPKIKKITFLPGLTVPALVSEDLVLTVDPAKYNEANIQNALITYGVYSLNLHGTFKGFAGATLQHIEKVRDLFLSHVKEFPLRNRITVVVGGETLLQKVQINKDGDGYLLVVDATKLQSSDIPEILKQLK